MPYIQLVTYRCTDECIIYRCAQKFHDICQTNSGHAVNFRTDFKISGISRQRPELFFWSTNRTHLAVHHITSRKNKNTSNRYDGHISCWWLYAVHNFSYVLIIRSSNKEKLTGNDPHNITQYSTFHLHTPKTSKLVSWYFMAVSAQIGYISHKIRKYIT